MSTLPKPTPPRFETLPARCPDRIGGNSEGKFVAVIICIIVGFVLVTAVAMPPVNFYFEKWARYWTPQP